MKLTFIEDGKKELPELAWLVPSPDVFQTLQVLASASLSGHPPITDVSSQLNCFNMQITE